MSGRSNLINKFNELENKKFRHAYLKEHIRIGIASQIRILRNKLNISQSQLAEIIGTKQSVISRIEYPDSVSVNLNTLLKIAEAFDIGLLVKFSAFGKFLAESQDISPKALAVNSYSEEQATLDPVRNISVRRAAFNRPKQQLGKDMANGGQKGSSVIR